MHEIDTNIVELKIIKKLNIVHYDLIIMLATQKTTFIFMPLIFPREKKKSTTKVLNYNLNYKKKSGVTS